MKTITHLFTLCFCILCCGNTLNVSAQSSEALSKAYQEMSSSLEHMKLRHNHLLMTEFINYCSAFDKLIDITKDEYLKTIVYETKPKELSPKEEAYQNAKDKLSKYLKSFNEYKEAEKARQEARTEVQKKAADAALSIVYNRLWNENKHVKELRSEELAALKAYRLAALIYMFDKFQKIQRMAPINIIDYQTKNYLIESNAELRNLTLEIKTMEALQKEVFDKQLRSFYQILENNVADNEEKQTVTATPIEN